MKNITLKLAISLLVVSTLFSCKDFLNKNPLSAPSKDNFYSNDAEVNMGVVGIYNRLLLSTDYGLSYVAALDHCTDVGWYRMANASLQTIGNGSHDAGVGFAMAFWRDAFSMIGRCNLLLDNMPKHIDNITPAVYERADAEARFFRAYNYALLSELYGDVPLIKTTLPLSQSSVSRNPKSEVVSFIVAELEAIAGKLPRTVAAGERGRINRWTVYALLSRVALYNGLWERSAAAASEVMKSGDHALDPSYAKIFTYDGVNSKETLFAIQYGKSQATWQALGSFGTRMVSAAAIYIPVQATVDSYECTDGQTIDKSPLYNPAKPFENRDPRLAANIALPGSEYMNYQFETHRDSVKCLNYTTGKLVDNIEATHAYASFSGYNWRKYTDKKDLTSVTQSELQFILFRYAEVLLNYAEAKIEGGTIDQSVLDAINSVRARAYGVDIASAGYPKITTMNKEELRNVVRRERKSELVLEGFRLFDIRRWRIAEKVMPGALYGRVKASGTLGRLSNAPVVSADGTPSYANVTNRADMFVIEQRQFNAGRDYLWPIPKVEVETNPNLLPNNPGY